MNEEYLNLPPYQVTKTTKNRSHTVYLSPNGQNDMTEAFYQAIESVKSFGDGTVYLEPGDYYFSSPETQTKSSGTYYYISNHDNPNSRKFFVILRNLKNVSIVSPGARFVCDGVGVGLTIVDCENIVLRGIAVDFKRPFYTEWNIVNTQLVQASEDYTYQIKNNAIYCYGTGWEQRQDLFDYFDGRTHKYLGRKNGAYVPSFQVADGCYVVSRNSYRPNPGVFLYRAKNIKFYRCGSYSGAGMGFLCQRSENIELDYWRTKGKRKTALQADAVHFSNCKGLIKITNSIFDGCVDDALNVHATSLKITSIDGNILKCQYMHNQSVGFETFDVGERVRFIKVSTLEPAEDSDLRTVVSATMNSYNTVTLELNEDVPDGYSVGDAIENADYQPDIEYTNNVIRNLGPRCLLLTTNGKVVIRDCMFDNVPGQTFYFPGDARTWYESGACKDVTIENNIVSRCCYYQGNGEGKALIQIDPVVQDLKSQTKRYHSNITIQNNTFKNFTQPLVYARSCSNVMIKNSTIINGNSNKNVDSTADVTIIS